jgi:hypothetical protein
MSLFSVIPKEAVHLQKANFWRLRDHRIFERLALDVGLCDLIQRGSRTLVELTPECEVVNWAKCVYDCLMGLMKSDHQFALVKYLSQRDIEFDAQGEDELNVLLRD